jgi:acetoacetyl-CoA synthetase
LSAQPLWEPSAEVAAGTRLAAYTRWLERERELSFAGYQELWSWSVADLDGFWSSIWEHFEVRGSFDAVLGRREMPGAEWFPGAEVSYAEHLFHGKADDAVAIVHASELRPLAELTWGELRELTARIAAGLRSVGVTRGDRVVAYMPNIPEAAAAFLACASIGAIWSSCSPDFGVRSVVDRFAQIGPKVLLAVDGYRYAGKDLDRREIVAQLQREIPTLERTFVLPYLGSDGNWDELLRPGTLEPERLPFDHPLWVLYSSGTTGLPKAIVHGQGGILLEHLKTLYLQFDARPGDRLFWFTTTGWMMWNLLLGGLLTESAIVLYDGSPAAPDLTALWDLAERAGVTCFGTSAAYISACMKAGIEPAAGRDLSRLRSVGSTGSPLSPEGFRWVYEHVGKDTWLASMSGGTDVCSAFVGGVPTLPVYEGELQARSLGAKVEAFDEHGASVIGEVGELVLTEPLPSMPLYLWGDDDGSRYRESYFTTFPGVWRHGDWITITGHGSIVVHGRSDSTLNRHGIRMGSADIYQAVERLPEIAEALVIGAEQPDGGYWMPLFVVLADDAELTDELRDRIRRTIREEVSPRHVPDDILLAPGVPHTRTGKKLEVPIKKLLQGADAARVVERSAVDDPALLDWYAKLRR